MSEKKLFIIEAAENEQVEENDYWLMIGQPDGYNIQIGSLHEVLYTAMEIVANLGLPPSTIVFCLDQGHFSLTKTDDKK